MNDRTAVFVRSFPVGKLDCDYDADQMVLPRRPHYIPMVSA
jgi:hypothetical protein